MAKKEMKTKAIIKPFNRVFWIVIAAAVITAILGNLLLGQLTLDGRRHFLTVFYLAALVHFFIYKCGIARDTEYYNICGYGEFTWWNELPINLCNIIILLMPIGVITACRPILAVCYFCSMLGPVLALFMPGKGFSGYSFYLPRINGYYITHCLAIMAGPFLFRSGIYRPVYGDVPILMLSLFLLSFGIFLIDLAMRKSGINPVANYFFTLDPEGNPVLELFHKWLPYPYLSVTPVFAVIFPIFYAIAFLSITLEHLIWG